MSFSGHEDFSSQTLSDIEICLFFILLGTSIISVLEQSVLGATFGSVYPLSLVT